MSSIDIVKQIHQEIDRLMRKLSVEDQELILKEAHKIVEAMKKIGEIAAKSTSTEQGDVRG